MSSCLASREKACAVLARSLVEEREDLKRGRETKSVCSCWSLVLKGLPVVEYHKDTVQFVVLWLHPTTLELCVSQKTLAATALRRMPLAHVKAVHADSRLPKITPLSPLHFFLSFEAWTGDIIAIALPTAAARDSLVDMFKDIVKVIDVMSCIEDHVRLYLENHPAPPPRRRSTLVNQVDSPEVDSHPTKKGGWTPADLDAWLRARRLSPLFVPLNAYLSDAYGRGDAHDTLLRLTDDAIDHIVVNQHSNQYECSPHLVQLRHDLAKHIGRARTRFFPKLFKLF
ncbi:Aste57867_21973 [Aphanomyces stellatus]|uniref:Aste57867_21973 protein n=1 Tax=Aphanomyces stellatus TaxID=120398 RepID=A0A485LL04_9STRA|nr:hypothetical protein As57867_021904 [Aphanomyces stellatus]VFT98641.1 Aste57867_21973 [Aphanomyces stellatus]